MEKINVAVCTGTACFVMGASDLMLLEERLPDDLKDRVSVSGETCMEKCKRCSDDSDRPPFVTIDGEVMGQANVPEIIERLYRLVQERDARLC